MNFDELERIVGIYYVEVIDSIPSKRNIQNPKYIYSIIWIVNDEQIQ